MFKMKPKKFVCVNCSHDYKYWHESCAWCSQTNVIRPKSKLEEKKEKEFIKYEPITKFPLLPQLEMPRLEDLEKFTNTMTLVNKWYIESVDKIIKRKLSLLEQRAFALGEMDLLHVLYKYDFDKLNDIEKMVLELDEAGFELRIETPNYSLPSIAEDEPFKLSISMDEVKISIKKKIVEI